MMAQGFLLPAPSTPPQDLVIRPGFGYLPDASVINYPLSPAQPAILFSPSLGNSLLFSPSEPTNISRDSGVASRVQELLDVKAAMQNECVGGSGGRFERPSGANSRLRV